MAEQTQSSETTSSRAPKPKENKPAAIAVAVGITFGIAALGPLTQIIGTLLEPEAQRIDSIMNPPPPPPPPEPPPPPQEQEEEEEPELEEQRQPPSLEQLELAMNPSMGDLGGAISMPDFNVEDDLSGMVFDIQDVDRIPERISGRDPVTPPQLRQRNVGGQVIIHAVITKDGRVRDPTVIRTDNQLLNAPAINAFRTWQFRPATKNGEPVNVRVNQPINFEGRR